MRLNSGVSFQEEKEAIARSTTAAKVRTSNYEDNNLLQTMCLDKTIFGTMDNVKEFFF